MFEKVKNWLIKMNQEGFPLPTLKDPSTGKGSITLTMFWVSFNIAILTLAGKVVKITGDVQYDNVLWLLGITGSFYLGRKMQAGKDGITVDKEQKAIKTVVAQYKE